MSYETVTIVNGDKRETRRLHRAACSDWHAADEWTARATDRPTYSVLRGGVQPTQRRLSPGARIIVGTAGFALLLVCAGAVAGLLL